ncbi:RNA polymerase sigma-70 factor [Sphingobacterium sp. SRCM116780]|uniref:RNA polymerase sigma-70 factor n=1 Tax=Sphingobacterium sp. SRCM116780 TaxID=2907623 RepID=UPI001F3D3740|nr:RNA polymerase sigma-70 factor [Sphingobacterium sp. SRCM116780]UIR55509.1 RNA polymerase sigma-70 factor [Sphingobacterium sp. SRCM116780]
MESGIFIINTKSFEQIYLQYWEGMFAFCLKNIQDEDLAKEIIQEVFKSLWERRDTLHLKEVERYLIRSVKLKTFEYIRNKVSRQQHIENFTSERETHYTEDPLVAEELSQKISRLINDLPKQCKNVFQMSRNQGLTNKEIAHKLYISERAVEYHISKALKALKTELTDYIC